MINKTQILDYAETFDAWRIVPRIVLFAYAIWLSYVVDRLLNWYMDLPIVGQTVGASGFCLGAITAVTGIGGYVYRIYSENGRDWEVSPSIKSTTTVETKGDVR